MLCWARSRIRAANRSSSGVLASPSKLGGKPLQFHELEEPFLDRQLEVLAKQRPVNVTLVGLNDRVRLQPGHRVPCPIAFILLAHPQPRRACRYLARQT